MGALTLQREEQVRMPAPEEFTTFAADLHRELDGIKQEIKSSGDKFTKLSDRILIIETKMQDRDHTAEQRANYRVMLIAGAFVFVDEALRHFHLFT